MRLKHYCLAAMFAVFLCIMAGCGSGSYKIENTEKKDTTTFKSTGAKLKNFYKIQNSPKLTLQLSGGLNLGIAELSSNYQNNFDSADFSKGLNFGVKNGFAIMLTGKIPLHEKGNIRLNVSGAFNRFKSDFLASESPYGDVTFNVMTLGVGVENSFNPSFRLKPFLAAEITGNIIYGNANIISPALGTTREVKFRNSFRLGYMIYGGLEYMFNNKVGMNFGVKLTNSNQLLKNSSKDSDPNSVTIKDQKINDSEEQLEFAGWKNFIYTSIYAGVNFYFGVKDIIYQFNK